MTHARRLAALPMLAALAVLFAPVLLSGDPIYGFDVIHEKLYWHDWVWRTWGRGEIPTWNPHLACGVPFLANSNASPLYPLAAIHLLLPTNAAVTLLEALHLAILGLGVARLTRALGGGAHAEGAAAAVAALGGFAMGRVMLGSLPQLFAVAWAPWIWALTLEGARSSTTRPFGLAAGACGLSLLAGHPQFTAIGLLAAGVQLLVERPSVAAMARFALVPVGGLVLASAQVLPLIELMRERGGVGTFGAESIARLGTLPVWQVPQLLVPGLFGDGLTSTYVGAFLYPLLVAHVGAIAWILVGGLGRDVLSRAARGPLAVAGLGMFLALDLDLAAAVRSLPPFDLFRLHGRWLGLTALGLAVLAGLGLDRVMARHDHARLPPPGVLLPLVAGVALLAVLATGADGPYWKPLYEDWADASTRLYMDSVFEAEGARAAAHRHALLLAAAFVASSAFALAALALARRRTSSGRLGAAVVVALALELALGAAPYVTRYDRELVWSDPPGPLATADAEHPQRFASALPAESTPLPGALNQAYLWLNTVAQASYHRAIAWDLESVQASLWPIAPAFHAIATGGAPFEQQFYVHRGVLDLVGARHVLVPAGVPLESVARRVNVPDEARIFDGLRRVATVDRVAVLENPRAFPRVFPVRAVEVVGSNEEAVERVIESGFPLRERAVVEESVAVPDDTSELADGFRFRRPAEREIEIDATLARGALLVITEAFDRGWRAELDGAPVALHRADAAFLGVVVPAGAHTIALRHEPWYAVPGLVASALAWLALGAALVATRRRLDDGSPASDPMPLAAATGP